MDIRGLLAGPETLMSVGSGMLAQPLSGLAGLLALPAGPERAAQAVRTTQERLTYQPQTQQGQRMVGALGGLLEPLATGWTGLQKAVGDTGYALGGPLAGALGQALPDAAAMALPFAGRLARNSQVPATLGKERGIFAGVGAKTADLSRFEEAQRLAKSGATPDDIWNKTGWFQGADKKWRFEIDDSGAQFNRGRADMLALGQDKDPLYGGTVGDVVKHGDLYGAYPQTRNISLDMTKQSGGAYSGEFAGDPAVISMNPAGGSRTALHELQHAVQDGESFARGGSAAEFTRQAEAKLARDALSWRNELLKLRKEMPQADWSAIENRAVEQYQKLGAMDMLPSREARELARQPNVLFPQHFPDSAGGFNELQNLVSTYALDKRVTPLSSMDAYRRLAGEVEARAVESRMNLTPEQRRALPPWQSYDVPVEQQIVRFK